MKNFLGCLTLLLATSFSYGQIGDGGGTNGFDYTKELAKSVKAPVSPEAEAFMVFGDVPVNTYTGQLNYSVPLDAYQGYEMSLPINLSYNPGIKVNQLATGAGLGWNLQVGGRITRVVNGLPDNGVPESIFDSSLRDKLLAYHQSGNNFQTINEAWDNYFFLRNIRDNRLDAFPDYYQLNVMGINETIVFDVAGDMMPKVISNPRIKVSADAPSSGKFNILSWTITGEDGTRYFFNKAEKTYKEANDINDTSPAQNYNSSWVLTKIISPNGLDTFDLQYITQPYSSEISTLAEYQTASTTLKDNFQTNYGVDNLSSYIPDIRIQQQFLHKILHNTRTIYDIDLDTRYDYWQKNTGNATFSRVNNRINEIAMYTYNSETNQNEFVRSVALQHTYFGQASYADNPTTVSKFASKNIRLKLDQLDFKAADGEVLHSYKFDYYSADKVKSRRSFSRDYLGYDNGASNSVLYPKLADYNINMSGANRSVNPLTSQRGSLKSVTYPTGGTSEFIYENHRVSKSQNKEPELMGVVSAAGGFSDFPCYGLCLDKYVQSPMVRSRMVYIPEGGYDLSMKKTGTDQGNGTSTGFEVWVIKRPSDQVVYDGFIGAGGSIMPNSDFAWSRSYGNNFTQQRHLERGWYQLTVVNSIIGTNLEVRIVDKNYNEKEIVQEPVPGLRLRYINNYDHNQNLLSTKEYRYTETLNSEHSSARQLYKPSLIDFVTAKKYSAEYAGVIDVTRVVRRSGVNESPQGHIVYGTVFEIQKSSSGISVSTPCDNAINDDPIIVADNPNDPSDNPFVPVDIDNGYTETNYNVGVNGIVPESFAPFANNYVSDYKMGKPKSVKIYNNCKELLQKTTYTYDSAPIFSSPGMAVHSKESNRYKHIMYLETEAGGVYTNLVDSEFRCIHLGCDAKIIWINGLAPSFCASENHPNRPANLIQCNGDASAAMMQARGKSVNGRIGFLTEETNVRYFNTDSIISQTHYQYDELSEYLLKEKEVALDGSETIKEVFYYPKNLVDNTIPDASVFNQDEKYAIQGLLSKNKRGVPIQTDTFKNEQRIASRITSYQNTQGSIYPKAIKHAKGTHPYEERIEFLNYSDKGKPTRIGIEGEKLLFYTYGYNGKYLTEEIKGVPMITSGSNPLSDGSILDTYPQALRTSYTYNILGKPIEITDPRGQTTTFVYDKFYRLKHVKDHDGNILSKNEYNYKND